MNSINPSSPEVCNCGEPATAGEAHFPDLPPFEIAQAYSLFLGVVPVSVEVFFLCTDCMDFAGEVVEFTLGELEVTS